jgi:hypothetical protein
MFLFDFTLVKILLARISLVKLQRESQIFLQKKRYMVEYSHLIVNDSQIKVNDNFLNFQIIPIRKIRDNLVYICLIGFRKGKFYGSVFNITYRITSMYSGNIVAVYDITVVNSNKRKR